jgi:UDP-glucose 4-epimerase
MVVNVPGDLQVGSGRPVSVHQFVSACRNVTGADIRVVEQEEARPGDYAGQG